MMKNTVFCILLGMFALGFLPACNDNYLVEAQKEIPNAYWMYNDTLNFPFEVKDTAKLYNIYLNVEHGAAFSSQNVYLKLYTQFPDGKRLSKVFPVDFYDAQGEPYGKCTGDNCRLRAVLQEKAFFNKPGQYVITVEQYMRQDSLPGISMVGLAVEAVGSR